MPDTSLSSPKFGEHVFAEIMARFAQEKANDAAAATQLLEKERQAALARAL